MRRSAEQRWRSWANSPRVETWRPAMFLGGASRRAGAARDVLDRGDHRRTDAAREALDSLPEPRPAVQPSRWGVQVMGWRPGSGRGLPAELAFLLRSPHHPKGGPP